MKVSIIIPVYKVEAYLKDCMDSVLRQTYQDYEVILVDDGSPDSCGEICDAYAAQYPRITVIHKTNGGLSSARNAGLDVARGTYIYFLDSDDTIDPKLLETAVDHMDKGLDLLAFRYNVMRKDTPLEPDRIIPQGEFSLTTEENKLAFIRDVFISGKIGWEAWSRVFVRDKIQKYKLRFADNRKIFAEDLYFSLCYLAHADRVECISDCLYNYRIRQDSIMGVQQKKSNLGRICFLAEEVLRFYRSFEDCLFLENHFPQIYYPLIVGQFKYQMWASGIAPAEFIKMVRNEVEDWSTMERKLREYLQHSGNRKDLREAELRAHALFLLGGSELAFRLRLKALRTLRGLGRGKSNA